MKHRLRAAIVGCGRIGTFTSPELAKILPPGWLPLNHAEAIATSERLELVALCDNVPENLERASRIHGCRRLYTDYRALIAAERPEVLALATRTAGRCDIIEYASEHGVRGMHVEKPISTSMRDVRRALDSARSNGVLLTYGTTRRFMDVYQEARAIVRRGELGALKRIVVQYGDGLLMWTHPHSADLLVFFAEDTSIRSVEGACTIACPTGAEPTILDEDPTVQAASVCFTNGVTGLITSETGDNTRVYGTRGCVTVAADGAWLEVQVNDSDGSRRSTPRPTKSGAQRAFEELATAIEGDTALPPMSLEEIYASQQILLSTAWSSLHDGRAVHPNEVPVDFVVSGRHKGNYA